MNNILEVTELSKDYGEFALKNVSFSVPEGSIMGFVGPNGAGKTTTIKALLGMINYASGDIQAFGQQIKDNQEIKQQMGVVMDLPFYVADWKVKDVEAAISPFYRHWSRDEFSNRLEMFGVSGNKKVKELSRGMKVKLMLAAALSHGASLLVLDEPTSGLDPVARDELMDILLDFISDEKKGILFSTHITGDLEKIADYVTLINEGHVVYTGSKDALLESYALIKGGLSEITEEQKRLVIGFREHGTGFEAMVNTSDTGGFSQEILIEPVSLEEIIVFMGKRRNGYVQTV